MSDRAMFTAAEIAQAAGRARRVALRKLATIAPAGEVLVNGQPAKAWAFEALPEEWRAEIGSQARARGFRDERHLLAAKPGDWTPKIPLGDVAQRSIDKALKLKRALAGSLARLNDLSFSDAEMSELGRADYRNAFGHEISEKQWRRLFDRTVERDGGAEDWQRTELYLDDKCARRDAPAAARTIARAGHRELAEMIGTFQNPTQPSEMETRLVWQAVFDRYEDLQGEGQGTKAARCSLVDFLAARVPFLASNRPAMLRVFKYKFLRWEAGGKTPDALTDGRAIDAESRKFRMPEDDRKTVLAHALKLGGGISQGWREARNKGVLSLEVAGRYIENPASKSHVPKAVAREIRYDHKMLADVMRGPRTAQLNGAFIERDPTTFASGDWQQGDDLTAPVYFWEDTGGGPRLMRGQTLAMIDCRSTYILGFVLISAEQDRGSSYNAWHIRNLITQVHDTYGLPRKGFAFENGTWRSKLLVGSSQTWNETELGLRAFGVRFQHSRLPRAKLIERVFGAVQNLMEAEPGYCGRNEQVEKHERMQRHKALVQSGRAAPQDFFHSRDEWCERLVSIFEHYNSEPQDGKYLRDPKPGEGLSPREAYERFFGKEPLAKLPDSARYLLANERKRLRVGRNGISFVSRGDRFTYKNARTGELRGREVEVFFNYEHPEILGVKDPTNGQAFAVRRATIADGMDAPDEQLRQAYQENAEHEGYRRALYRSLLPKFSEHFMTRPVFRRPLVDAATAETGEQLSTGAAREMVEAEHARTIARKTATAAGRVGMKLRPGARSEEQLEAVQRLSRLMEKAGKLEAEPAAGATAVCETAATATGKKTYTLKAAPAPLSRQQLTGLYWKLWQKIEKAQPALSRHALTHRALGCNPALKSMSAEQLARVVKVFTAVARPAL
jgi:hypothetical protein